MKRVLSVFAFVSVVTSGVCTLIVTPVTLSAATTCENLASLKLPDTTITSADAVPAGGFTQPGARGGGRGGDAASTLPAFCRVAATVKPSSDSDIKIEVWLPTSNWNGKLQAVGNGAFNGAIGYDRATVIVKKATASGRPLREVALEEGVDAQLYDETIDLRRIARGNTG